MSSVWSVMQSIYTHWNSNNLDSHVSGGLWANVAPSGTAYPHAVYDMLSNTVDNISRQTDTQLTYVYGTSFQIVIYGDNLSVLGNAIDRIRNVYDYGNLVLLGDSGSVLQCKYVNEIPRKLDDSVWQWMLEYEVQRHASILG
jgi:hypothetical protein